MISPAKPVSASHVSPQHTTLVDEQAWVVSKVGRLENIRQARKYMDVAMAGTISTCDPRSFRRVSQFRGRALFHSTSPRSPVSSLVQHLWNQSPHQSPLLHRISLGVAGLRCRTPIDFARDTRRLGQAASHYQQQATASFRRQPPTSLPVGPVPVLPNPALQSSDTIPSRHDVPRHIQAAGKRDS